MVDFLKPTVSSNYSSEFLPELKARDDEALKQSHVANTGIPTGTLRWGRVGTVGSSLLTGIVEEWNGSSWIDRGGLAQPGDLKMSAQSSDHTGWLLCNGRAVSAASYDALWKALGQPALTGGNFNIPDLQRRVPFGAGTGYSFGGNEGQATVTNRNIDHAHSLPAHYHGMGGGGATLAVDINHDHASFTSGGQSVTHTHTMNHDHTGTVHGESGHTHTINHGHTITQSPHAHNRTTRVSSTNDSGGSILNRSVSASSANSIDYASSGAWANISINDHNGSSGGGSNHGHGLTVDTKNQSTGDASVDHTHSIDVPALGATSKTPTGSIGNVTSGNSGDGTALSTGSTKIAYSVVNFFIKV